jgi:hypothetical protein
MSGLAGDRPMETPHHDVKYIIEEVAASCNCNVLKGLHYNCAPQRKLMLMPSQIGYRPP